MRGSSDRRRVLVVACSRRPLLREGERAVRRPRRLVPSLKVNDHGVALVTYRTTSGAVRHVYVWGAINANAPDPGSAQVRFSYDYTGGLKRNGRQTWRTFPNHCRPYDGPKLVWLVNACKAPDGSYWALQRWQRLLPMRGIAAVQARAGRVRAAPLALVGAAPGARGVAELDVRRPLARAVRAPHLPRASLLRIPHAVVPRPRLLRTLLLRRHVQLASSGLAGSTTPARSPTAATAPSVTASCPSGRRPATRRTSCGRPGTASVTGSP